MSTKDDIRKAFSHQNMIERLYLFRETIKSSYDENITPKGLSSANIHNYKARKSIPSGGTLEEWGANFGLNVNWLLWGEGPMLRTDAPAKEETSAAQDEIAALQQRIRDLEAIVATKEKELNAKNEALLSARDETLNLFREMHAQEHRIPREGIVPGGSNAVPSSLKKTD